MFPCGQRPHPDHEPGPLETAADNNLERFMLHRQFIRFVHWIGYDLGITPNQITLGRLIFFVPGWFLWLYREEVAAWLGIWWQTVGLFAFLLVTAVIILDVVDGTLARETGQVSRQGKILDPAVDKFITYSTLILFWNAIDQRALLILFALDIASTFLRGTQAQGANEFGKKKALAQNISKIFFCMAVLLSFPRLNFIGNVLIWIALILAAVSVGVRLLPAKGAKNRIYLLIPQLLTLANMACGGYAIWSALQGRLVQAVVFVFAAMAFDLSDGAAARRLGVESVFGVYFDTTADLISFGCAPALIVAAAAEWHLFSLLSGGLYIGATAYRLYDYGKSKQATPKGFFRGFPSPAAAWLSSISVLCLPAAGFVPVQLLAAGLMCSFSVNWLHFSRVLPSLAVLEIIVSSLLGLLIALKVHPLTFLAGPIVVYLFSPLWRKPDPARNHSPPARD
jgi:CDP-diacylglycerol--serine O-phosphatidyltransferase